MRAEGRDLLPNTIQNPRDRAGLKDTVAERRENHVLRNLATDTQVVIARTTRSGAAAVVAAAHTADERNAEAATAADHRSREQVRRVRMDPRPLTTSETTRTSAGPDGPDRAATLDDAVPKLLGNDPERLVVPDHPLGLGLLHIPAAAGPTITASAPLVPDPVAGVLGVVENAEDRANRPALARADSARDAVLVQLLHDACGRHALREASEDAQEDIGLRRVDAHEVPLRPRAAPLVVRDGASRLGTIAEGRLAHEIAAQFLSELPAMGLLAKVGEEEFIEDAAYLNAENRVIVTRVEVIPHGDNPNALVLEVVEEQEHEDIVPGEPGKVIDQNDVEHAPLRGLAKGKESGPVGNRSGLGMIRVLAWSV